MNLWSFFQTQFHKQSKFIYHVESINLRHSTVLISFSFLSYFLCSHFVLVVSLGANSIQFNYYLYGQIQLQNTSNGSMPINKITERPHILHCTKVYSRDESIVQSLCALCTLCADLLHMHNQDSKLNVAIKLYLT